MLKVINSVREHLLAGIVVVRGVRVLPSAMELIAELEQLVQLVQEGKCTHDVIKVSVRTMLRSGGFKPSGRSKPASEYLAQAASEQRFPFINNLVDCNNYLSLKTGLPVSMLDLKVAGEAIEFRFGQEEERYEFNSAGHVINLKGLICTCCGEVGCSEPIGNPVKDSMRAKVTDFTTEVLGVVYAPRNYYETFQLKEDLQLFGDLLKRFGSENACSVETLIC